MFKPLIILLMIFCCNLIVAENALSQMSEQGLKDMREGIMRAQKKKAAEEAAMKKKNSENSSGSASKAAGSDSRGGSESGSATRMRSEVSKAMNKTDTAAPSFELFEVKPNSLMAVLDSDGDGQLSGKEIDFATDQLLRLDANDNGQIDVDELPGTMEAAAAAPSGFDRAYKGPGEQVYKTIAGFDADANGVLTRSEMRAEYRGAFRAIDSDGNREIDPKELLEFSKSQ